MRRTLVGLSPLIVAIFALAGAAAATVPTIYHSPADDGVPPAGPVEIPDGASATLHLYIDAGSNPSTQVRCHDGTGDEICAWDLILEGQNGLGISGFTPHLGVVHYLSGSTLQLNGGDPWRGTLGPQKLGDAVVLGTTGGNLDLLPSESVNAAMGTDTIPQATLITVPEPGSWAGLLSGGLLLRVLARRRRRAADRSAAHGSQLRVALLLAAFVLAPQLIASPAAAQTPVCGDVVVDDVLDIQDIDAIRLFLTGDPSALDLQNDADLLARCDVSNNSQCDIQDYARIKRYMLGLPSGMASTCPHDLPSSVVLEPPTLDQASTIDTDRASVLLSGTAEPGDPIRVTGAHGQPMAITDPDGTWAIEVPLKFAQTNLLDVFRDFGAGRLSANISLSVSQNSAVGTSTLEGRLIDAADGEPLLGDADITVDGTTYATDEWGRFEVNDLPEGLIVVRAEKTGYVPELAVIGADRIQMRDDSGLVYEPLRIGLTARAASTSVDAAGATLTSPNGIELVIPAGSLASATDISLTELRGDHAQSFDGIQIVDIGPGPITFDPPATLRIPSGTTVDGASFELGTVDHETMVIQGLAGTTTASGFVEIPIHSVNGTNYTYRVVRERIWDELTSEVVMAAYEGRCDRDRPRFMDMHLWNMEFSTSPGSLPFLGFLEANPKILGADLWRTPPLTNLATGTYQGYNIRQGETLRLDFKVHGVWYIEEVFIEYWPPGDQVVKRIKLGSLGYQRWFAFEILKREDIPKDCPEPKGAGHSDPHLINFDHVGEAIPDSSGTGRYEFQATGEFVFFESTEDGMVVQTRMQPANNSTSVIKAAAMDVDGDRVSIYSDIVLDVRIEGVPTPLTVGVPVALPGGGELERGTTGSDKDVVTVRWSDGSEMPVSEWTTGGAGSYLNLFPKLDSARFGKVQGLLGNANGVLGDDYNLRDGTPAIPAEKYTTYADSWRISQAESLFDYVPPEDTSTYNGTPTIDPYTCDELDPAVQAAAEADCIAAGITTDPRLCECTLDVAVMGTGAEGAAAYAKAQMPDRGIVVNIPAQSNVWGAGRASVPDFGAGGGNGILPPQVDLPPGTGRTLRFLDAGGLMRFANHLPWCAPDGLPRNLTPSYDTGIWDGLSGPFVDVWCQLTAVFLSDEARPATPPAQTTCVEHEEPIHLPEIGQIFCPGDGLTPEGEPQTFIIPDDATRLFFGYLESWEAQSGNTPGWYNDSSGQHDVIIEVAP